MVSRRRGAAAILGMAAHSRSVPPQILALKHPGHGQKKKDTEERKRDGKQNEKKDEGPARPSVTTGRRP
jgi:hypothetical protein